jgi:VWFA-related protein
VTPLAVAVALDNSFSMAGPQLELARSAARIFLGELRPADEAMILSIGSEVQAVAPLSTDRRAHLDAVARIDAFGTTALHDAIIRAIDAVQPAKGRRALVLLSDGDDKYSSASADAAVERARRSDVMVYPVGLGKRRPGCSPSSRRSPAAGLSTRDAKGCRTRSVPSRAICVISFARLHAVAANSARRRGWRAIGVTVKRPGARVRARIFLAR